MPQQGLAMLNFIFSCTLTSYTHSKKEHLLQQLIEETDSLSYNLYPHIFFSQQSSQGGSWKSDLIMTPDFLVAHAVFHLSYPGLMRSVKWRTVGQSSLTQVRVTFSLPERPDDPNQDAYLFLCSWSSSLKTWWLIMVWSWAGQITDLEKPFPRAITERTLKRRKYILAYSFRCYSLHSAGSVIYGLW